MGSYLSKIGSKPKKMKWKPSDKAYVPSEEGVILSCYFNPKRSKHRLNAFNIFYESIKHLNHRIIECAIGDGSFELEENPNIQRVRAESLLWHKECLLNKLLQDLPPCYKFVFWIDADVMFSNPRWFKDGCIKLSNGFTIIQPFGYAIHLDRDLEKPLDVILNRQKRRSSVVSKPIGARRVWKSFAMNYENGEHWDDLDYDIHGFVGFAWGAQRHVLDNMHGLYERGLIGGADHIMAHAAVGQIGHPCVSKLYEKNKEYPNKENKEYPMVIDWSQRFYAETKGKLGFIEGDAYHIWHGNLDTRQYFQRQLDFNNRLPYISKKDRNGFYSTTDDITMRYFNNYFDDRECHKNNHHHHHCHHDNNHHHHGSSGDCHHHSHSDGYYT